MITVSLFLTIMRLIFSLTLLPYFLISFMPGADYLTAKLLVLFVGLLCLTDFFDGYCARLWHQESKIGEILDPLADKALVIVTLLIFVYLDKILWYWALILIAREILVTVLRYLLKKLGKNLPVSSGGKFKSTMQYIYICMVIGKPYSFGNSYLISIEQTLEQMVLMGAVTLSLVSLLHYGSLYVRRINK